MTLEAPPRSGSTVPVCRACQCLPRPPGNAVQGNRRHVHGKATYGFCSLKAQQKVWSSASGMVKKPLLMIKSFIISNMYKVYVFLFCVKYRRPVHLSQNRRFCLKFVLQVTCHAYEPIGIPTSYQPQMETGLCPSPSA